MSVPRIAISGSAGTGKSTLGRALADRLGVPFIAEGMRLRIEAGLWIAGMTLDARLDLARELWREHAGQVREAQRTGFVADRSAGDFAAFRLADHLIYHETADDEMRAILGSFGLYEQIVVLPWGAIPLAEDGVRSTNPWHQFRFQTLLEGVLRRFAPPEQVLMVKGADSVETRAAAVLAATGRKV